MALIRLCDTVTILLIIGETMLELYNKNYLPTIVDIYVRAFKAEPICYDWLNKEQALPYLYDITITPKFEGYVYKLNKKIIGFCFAAYDDYFQGCLFDIKEFAIEPSLHNKGVGSLFLAEIEKKVRTRGCDGIILRTSKNIPAFYFYTKNGYEDVLSTACLTKIFKN